jgi:hypothetical protein
MAIKKLTKGTLDPHIEEQLSAGLVAELQRDEKLPQPPNAPTIYMEESGTPDNYTHWYVVWSAFENVDDEERSRLLLSAVREVFGVEEALRVTVAMGLTPEEAKGMGLS